MDHEISNNQRTKPIIFDILHHFSLFTFETADFKNIFLFVNPIFKKNLMTLLFFLPKSFFVTFLTPVFACSYLAHDFWGFYIIIIQRYLIALFLLVLLSFNYLAITCFSFEVISF